MVYIRVVVVEFDKGYHVGWRELRRIIDHTTILRALIYVAYLTNAIKCIEVLSKGGLEASALLPTVSDSEEQLRLLAPFPKIPCLGKAGRVRGLFVTLSTLGKVLNYIARCGMNGGVPVAQEVIAGDEIMVKCAEVKKEVLVLKKVKGIACMDKECDKVTPRFPEELFSIVSEYRNRIDRLTGATDVFEVYRIKPFTHLWLAFRGSEEAVECGIRCLEVLQRLGIGGLRSRGWGRFRVVTNAKVSSEDREVLERLSGWLQGYNYLLGLMPPGDWVDIEHTYATREVIMGLAGPSNNEYRLPIIYTMDIGSIVYAKTPPLPQTFLLDGGRAILLFNPVTIQCRVAL